MESPPPPPLSFKINSYVFFDLETSGLDPYLNEITEICLIAVHRSAFQDNQASPTPRVVDKLVLCVDPKQKLSATAQSMSGLSQDTLQESCKPPFDKRSGEQIIHLLERQQSPVCLLAHNGDKFDFQFLRRSLKKVGLSLPKGVRCADTLNAFREIKPLLKSHSMAKLYLEAFGGPIEDAHQAEGDTVALMKLFLRNGEKMMRWCDHKRNSNVF